MIEPTKLLILGDGPFTGSGLGRIGFDLATLLSSMPEFDVGYLARGGYSHRSAPWMQYNFPISEQWGENLLQPIWHDFAGDKPGILLTVWDATRLMWLADPTGMPNEKWLRNPPFKKWGYFMQDGEGVRPGTLPMSSAITMQSFDRILLASKWAYGLATNTFQHPDTDWLPHGIDCKVFKPNDQPLEDRATNRKLVFNCGDRQVWGCVMTNQARKHWPTVIEALSLSPDAFLWAHVDQLLGYWNLPALVVEYGVEDRVFLDVKRYADKDMAYLYGLCDLTMLISGGEGFGYPVAESLACGVTVITGEYGAAAELNIEFDNVNTSYSLVDTQHNVRRAVYDAKTIAAMCKETPYSIQSVAHLDWPKIGIEWKKWFRKGI